MNARVFLLVLVTAVFMAIWDADRPTELQHVVAQSSDATATASVGRSTVEGSAAKVATNAVSQADPALPPASANDEKLIPLPKGLATGTWHAFNHAGDSIRITIELLPASSPSPMSNVAATKSTAANTCVITGSDGVHWCFVKEEAAKPN